MSKNVEFSILLDFYASVLTDKQRDVTEMYYYEDLSLAEIADATGITRQGVSDAIKRSEEIITDLEEKIGFARWFMKTAEGLEKIEADAKAIAKSNSAFLRNEIVADACKDILGCIKEMQPEKAED